MVAAVKGGSVICRAALLLADATLIGKGLDVYFCFLVMLVFGYDNQRHELS
jgi:hypothetical protein